MRISDWSSDVCSSDLPGTPAAMSVSSYPLVEKWKWIWIWLGDPAKADEGLIPDHDWLLLSDESLITTPFFTVELGCNIQIFHDNLLDASHLSYVHLGSLDNGGIAAAKYKIEEEGQSDRERQRLNSITKAQLVCRLLLE